MTGCQILFFGSITQAQPTTSGHPSRERISLGFSSCSLRFRWIEPTRSTACASCLSCGAIIRRMFLGLLESLPAIPPHTPVPAGWNTGDLSAPPGHMAPENGCAVSPIRSLASETLEEIIAFTPPESHLALCLVSKLLYALCYRSIYCDISLRSPAAVVKCCRTVATNITVASAVKRFEISYASVIFFSSFGAH